MAKKHFEEKDGHYKITFTHENGGRVIDVLWVTTVTLDHEFNLIKFEKRNSGGEVTTEPTNELAKAITYAKGQVKKRDSGANKLYKVICQDAYCGHFYTKEVRKTTAGGYNSKEAGTSPNLIAEMTPKIEKKLETLKPYDQAITEMELALSKLRSERQAERDKIAKEIFKGA